MSFLFSSDIHPLEWLRRLEEEPFRYGQLVEITGSLALAAHHVATARCRVRVVATTVPTPVEIGAAALEIASRLDMRFDRLPSSLVLAAECESAGLPVIGPTRRRAA